MISHHLWGNLDCDAFPTDTLYFDMCLTNSNDLRLYLPSYVNNVDSTKWYINNSLVLAKPSKDSLGYYFDVSFFDIYEKLTIMQTNTLL